MVVHSMDRLARNLDDLRRIVRGLTQRGVRMEFVKRRADVHRRGLTDGQSDALSVMGAFAEFERALIRERQRGNRAGQTARCLPGTKKSLNSEQIVELKRRVAAGDQNLGGP